MTPSMLVLWLLALALLLSGVRLAWRVRGGLLTRGHAAIRFLGQAGVAALLWFALFPPPATAPEIGTASIAVEGRAKARPAITSRSREITPMGPDSIRPAPSR